MLGIAAPAPTTLFFELLIFLLKLLAKRGVGDDHTQELTDLLARATAASTKQLVLLWSCF